MKAEIGLKIRESYALDIDRLSMFQESMGLLDVEIGVPPRYGVRPDGDNTRDQDIRQRYNLPRVAGLIRPFPDQSTGALYEGLTLNDVNSEAFRQQIIQNYLQQNPNIALQPLQSQLTLQIGRELCPDNPAQIIAECGDSVPCMYDYTLFNSETLGLEIQNLWNQYNLDRTQVMRQYNSCGAINVEYPEFLTKTPAFASGYLQGDVVRFGCFQTHWIHGDYEYKCNIVVDYNDPTRYRFEWNKGNQPWCRAREIENFLKWLTAIASTIGIILVIVLIFLSCWCIKQRRRQNRGDLKPIRHGSVSPAYGRRNDAYEPEKGDAFSPSSRASSPVNDLRAHNSCGAINVEYPEFLTKTPAFASGYLQGDVVRFGCFQTHWIHGDYEYKCNIVVDYNDPTRYRFEWNKGNQPWCRAREIENFLKWLTAIASTIGIILVIVLIFLSCWCIKQRRRQNRGDLKPIRPGSVSPAYGRRNDAYEPEKGDAFSPSSRASSPMNDLRARGPPQQQPIAATQNSSFMGLNTSV
uniref:Sushi domain-containing protein n=1 Tax=Panagrolaimus sp. PS1159 TaxID=55785 RepID=A0AC35FTH8_9BILA